MKRVIIFIYIIIISIIDASSLPLEGPTCWWSYDYEVHIINDLPSSISAPDSSIPLRLHCASGDDDLGYHTLHTQRDFHWSFCMNIMRNTRFICDLWWGSTIAKSFDAFNLDIGLTCNTTCNWVAKQDGIYFTGNRDPTADLIKRYNWAFIEWYILYFISDFQTLIRISIYKF